MTGDSSASGAAPCSVAGCPFRVAGSVRLRLGGQPVDVPLCRRHAEHWRRPEPYPAPPVPAEGAPPESVAE